MMMFQHSNGGFGANLDLDATELSSIPVIIEVA